MTKEELLAIVRFMERVRFPRSGGLGVEVQDPIWPMLAYLMRQHLDGRLVTPKSLAAASGAPPTTAMRHIDRLIENGAIRRTPRTRSGKTFSLHPSPQLIERFGAMAQETKEIVAETFGMKSSEGYYFGSSVMAASIIPPPRRIDESEPRDTVRLLANDEPVYLTMRRNMRELARLSPVRLSLRVEPIDSLHEMTLRNWKLKRSVFDIVSVDLPWVGEYAMKGVLLPLDDLMRETGVNGLDFHPAGWEAGRYRGSQVAIPIQPMPELLFVRSDLFERERLALPARTGEVLEAARRLTDPVAGRHGIAWCGRQGTPVGQSFLQIMASFGNPVIDLRRSGGGYDLDVSGERMRPRLDRPEALATLEYMRELLEHSHPGVLDMSWPEVIEAFSGGKVAMAYAWSCRSGTFELDPSSPAHGRVAYLPHPSGPTGRSISPIGGAALGIPANLPKDRIAAAFRTMQWLTSPEMMKWYALRGTLVSARFSVSADPEVTEGRSVIKVVDGLAREGKLNLWPRPPIPELARITDILGLEVHACLRKERSPAQALQRSQSLVDALMRRQHHY